MTAAEAAIVATPTPGYCSDHPNHKLVTHRAAGLQWWANDAPLIVCPSADHTPDDRERCRWCGGRLVPAGVPRWRVSERREYCKPNHRLRAFRAAAAKGSTR